MSQMNKTEREVRVSSPGAVDASGLPVSDQLPSKEDRRGSKKFLQKVASMGAAALMLFHSAPVSAQVGDRVGGPDSGPPPPNVLNPDVPPAVFGGDPQSQEMREAREKAFRPVEFLHEYVGSDDEKERQAAENFQKIYGIASGVQRVDFAARRINEWVSPQDNERQNSVNGFHLMQGLGQGDRHGIVRIGLVAYNSNSTQELNVNPNIPITLVTRIDKFKKFGEEKTMLVHTVVLGEREPGTINPNDMGMLVQSVLYPFNRINVSNKMVDEIVREADGNVNIEKLAAEVKDPNSDLNLRITAESWRLTLTPLQDIINANPTMDLHPQLRQFHDGFKALLSETGGSEAKAEELTKYLSKGP